MSVRIGHASIDENGKHYSQNSTIYLCNRDTVNPVYNKLAELVGQFVVEV